MATDKDCKDHVILPSGRELNDPEEQTVRFVTFKPQASSSSRVPSEVNVEIIVYALTRPD